LNKGRSKKSIHFEKAASEKEGARNRVRLFRVSDPGYGTPGYGTPGGEQPYKLLKPMNFYRRNLPHLQPDGGEFFVTFNLAGSIPKHIILEHKEYRTNVLNRINSGIMTEEKRTDLERKIFLKYDSLLDNPDAGPVWLKEQKVADIIKEALHFRDQKEFDLYAYCIMSNHVHLVFKHLAKNDRATSKYPVTDIMGGIKKFTARESNQVLKRNGSFWQAESYDRLVRSDLELERVIAYTINNPVKAGLAAKWEDWPNTYIKKEFRESFI